jgi:hypothetical protein
MSRTFAFVFVCQRGELEIQSALLAASLRRQLRCNYELIAALPFGERPENSTSAFLKDLAVRFVPTGNEIDRNYPIGNKVDCLRIATDADKLVFLDSDMIVMRDFSDDPRFDIPFNARPASGASFSTDAADWHRIHRLCDAPLPTARIRTTHTGEYILPYFNAAFVAVPAKSGFGDVWLDCCKRIDRCPDVPNKRPHLDQIALAVAAAKLGMAMDSLDERFNYPINFKPLNELDLPFFCHYHNSATLSREPAAIEIVQSLAREHSGLTSILQSNPNWSPLLRCPISRRSTATPELIITGIPRSGTSLLCNLLHRLDNCVALNEPPEVAAMMLESPPWGLARFFRDIRRDVLDGKPLRNKLASGKVTQDTAVAGQIETYHPCVAASDFVLGIKTTLPFLSRLPQIRRVMPNARFVVCVRDPLETLASWKTSFAHLRDADIRGIQIGNPDDPELTGHQRHRLAAIAAIPETPARRAAWWAYWADLIHDSLEHLILVRYDDLAMNPRQTLDKFLSGWPAGNPLEPIEPSTPRAQIENLDDADISAARLLCRASAAKLGLQL